MKRFLTQAAQWSYPSKWLDLRSSAQARPQWTVLGKLLTLGILAAVGMGGVSFTQAPRPPLLQRVGNWPVFNCGPAWDVAVSGPYAYVAIGEGGLLVLDIRDPANPKRVGSYLPVGRTALVRIVGSRAYIATRVHRGGGCESDGWRGHLVILDLTDPTKPVPLGTFVCGTEIQSFYVEGNRVYMGNVGPEEQSFRVVDISNPAKPVALRVDRSQSPSALCIEGKRIYGGSWSSLMAMTVDEAGATTVLTNYDLGFGQIHAIQSDGQHLYVASGDFSGTAGMVVVDIAGGKSPQRIATVPFSSPALGLQLAAGYAYVAVATGGLTAVNITDPTRPKVVGTCRGAGICTRVDVTGEHALVADYHGGVQVIDLHDPAHMTQVAAFDTGLSARRSVVTNGTAYILSSDSFNDYVVSTDRVYARSRLDLVDLSNHALPVSAGQYEAAAFLTALDVQNGLAYLAGPLPGLQIVDCTDRQHPALLSDATTPSYGDVNAATSIQVNGKMAFVTTGDGTLYPWDVSTPTKPVWLRGTSTASTVVRVMGNLAYSSSGNELVALDVTDPKKPTQVGAINFNSSTASAGGLWVGSDLACVGMGWKGFSLVDVKQPEKPVVCGSYDTLGQVSDVQVDGNYLYVAESWEGLEIFDISERSDPWPIAKLATVGRARGVQISGNYAYAVEAGRGLAIFAIQQASVTVLDDPRSVQVPLGGTATLRVAAFGQGPLRYQWYVGESGEVSQPIAGAQSASLTMTGLSNSATYWVRVSNGTAASDSQAAKVTVVPPVSLDLLGLWPGWRRGPVNDVKVDGNLAYLALGNAGLWICDVSDPGAPQVLARQATKGAATALGLIGPFVCVAGAGLEVYDVSNSKAPVSMGRLDLGGSANKILVRASSAYLQGDIFRIVDLNSPTHPRLLGSYQEPGLNCCVLDVVGTTAFLAQEISDGPNTTRSLLTIDASDPTHPQRAGSAAVGGPISGITVVSNYAYVVTTPYSAGPNQMEGQFVVINVSNPSQPAAAATLGVGSSYSRDIAVLASQAYVLTDQGLLVVDVTNPARPARVTLLPWADLGCCPSRIVISKSGAYVSFGDRGLQIFDLTQASKPALAGSLVTGGFAQDVAVAGANAFLADSEFLRVLDVRDPAEPKNAAVYKSSNGTLNSIGMAPQPGVLYLGGDTLETVDVSDPGAPKSIGRFDQISGATAIRLANDCAYVVDQARNFHLLNAQVPGKLVEVASYTFTGCCGSPGLALAGSNAYWAVGWEGIQILDLSAPDRIKLSGAYYSDTDLSQVAIRGNIAAVTCGTGLPGLELVDLSDAQRPRRLGKVPLPVANSIDLVGPYACVTGQGLEVLDIGDPSDPIRVASHNLGVETRGLCVDGNLVYVAAGDYGLAVYRLTPQLKLDTPVIVGREVRLSWLGGPGARLQQTPSLKNPAWQDVEDSTAVSRLQGPATNHAGFFRLSRP